MNIGRKFRFSISFFIKKVLNNLLNVDEGIFMYGYQYTPKEADLFLSEFHEVVLFTYRKMFKSICLSNGQVLSDEDIDCGSNGITTDVGWGCMYRVAQMSISHGICQYLKSSMIKFNIGNIISNFRDCENAMFSIHNMVKVGFIEFGIKPRSWIGPTTSSIIASKLINDNKDIINSIKVSSIVYADGTIYRNKAEQHFSEMSSDSCTFVWICMKLGASNFDIDAYKDTIISMSSIPQFICIMGGCSYSYGALLIVAFGDNFLYCLDPHIKVHNAFSNTNYNRDEFIQNIPTKIYWEELDASLSMVFICRNISDFDNMCEELTRINSDLFEVIDDLDVKPCNRIELDSGFLIL
ncbi:putative peptidase family C54 [Cryptosporidium canis]|uniref:Cysteine protease n=1 Tax=Cryptosporidium canis TaxID=195482 RepID=A0ABQ8P6X0_9CRYT|nr:putative peptidase family C54 [Cryptosporidium canis]KAJ1612686.1 putative peptidase family C54 [Cryptosporidium canis]